MLIGVSGMLRVCAQGTCQFMNMCTLDRSDRTKLKLGDGALVEAHIKGPVKFPTDIVHFTRDSNFTSQAHIKINSFWSS